MSKTSRARQRRVSGESQPGDVNEEEVSEVPVPELSAVEQQIVLLVAQGRSRRRLPSELGLSLKTVDWHVGGAAASSSGRRCSMTGCSGRRI